jgi:hypothetical protein
LQHERAAVPRGDVVGTERERAIEGRERLVETSVGARDVAEVVERIGARGSSGRRRTTSA